MRFTKDSVSFHSDGCGRPGRPAVNIKIRQHITDAWRQYHERNPDVPARFCQDWLDENLDLEAVQFWEEQAAIHGFKLAEGLAVELFGPDVKCWQEGRSGGWLVVDGLPAWESWPAPLVAKWGKFERITRQYVDGVLIDFLDLVYLNVFLDAEDKQEADLREADARG